MIKIIEWQQKLVNQSMPFAIKRDNEEKKDRFLDAMDCDGLDCINHYAQLLFLVLCAVHFIFHISN